MLQNPLFTAQKARKRPWSNVEREAMSLHLGKFLRLNKVPGKK